MTDDDENFGSKRAQAEASRLAVIASGAGIGRLAEIAGRTVGGSLARLAEGNSLRDLMKKVNLLEFALEESTARQIAKIVNPYGDAIRQLQRQHGNLTMADRVALAAMPTSLAKIGLPRWVTIQDDPGALNLRRALHWAEHANASAFGSLIAKQTALSSIDRELATITLGASRIQGLDVGGALRSVSIGQLIARPSAFEGTMMKMSMLAGAIDTLGSRSTISEIAFGSLMGDWRTRPDLPPEYWQRPSIRKDLYRDAEVDSGLIDATNAEIVGVLIESGTVEGDVRGASVTAIVEAGPLSVRISATRPRLGAYRAITAFEIAMRGVVSQVLETAHRNEDKEPASWFKQRVPGDVARRARERHAEAVKAGEAEGPLIAFADLGDLIPIVTSGQNWPHFEPIFGSKEGFSVDMQRLNSLRRPTMHARPIDGVQLTEMVLTINRMTNMIKGALGWNAAWEDEG